MKYAPPGLICIISLLFFSSCNNHDAALSKLDSLTKNSNQTLAGQMYLFAPEYDSTNFVASSDGDCSTANTVFLDDSNFLYIDYCEEGDSYSRGIYHIHNDELEMHFDTLTVEKLFPSDGSDSVGNRSPEFTYSISVPRLEKLTYKKQDYKGHVVFKGKHEFGAVDIHGTADSTMKGVMAEGIWDRLTGKTKIVNPHAPAAVMPEILGIWADAENKNANFVIQESHIFYPDNSMLYKYELTQDSIRINYEGYIGAFAIKMIGTDTLIFDGHERQVFHRFKN